MRKGTLMLLLGIGVSGCQSSAAQLDQTSAGVVAPADNSTEAHSRQTVLADDVGQNVPRDFAQWLEEFRRAAAQQGIASDTLDSALGEARLLTRVIELDRAQPEFSRPVWGYLDSAVSATRISTGRAKLEAHRQTAERTQQVYGVPKEIVTAIWGIESNYGSNFGNFETIDALATLGYEGRRQTFARRELMAALNILQNGDIDRERMRGSWAGAMGHTQFLPSSFLAYAVDADGDNRRDIWNSIPDVMASTAHYLAEVGWRSGEPWGAEVRLPENFDYAQTELALRQPSAQWAAQGVQAMRGAGLPELESASVIAPAGARGPAFLVGTNFRVIMKYNASTSYALAVALLSDRIAGRPGLAAEWPREEPALSRSQIKELQALLNERGMNVGEPDGIVGPNTRRGLREYQQLQGMIPDGFATQELLKNLRRR
ncbi:lytic murein transglycosylase [Halomonas sp. WWR20]